MLTVKQIEAASYGVGPDRIADLNGLYLRLNKGGSKTFQVCMTVDGRCRWKTIGRFPDLTLREARLKAVLEKSGESDPSEEGGVLSPDQASAFGDTRSVDVDRTTLRDVAKVWFERKRRGLSNGKHALQNWTTINDYVLPDLGDLRPSEIKRRDVIRVLDPIWRTKHETARRTLGRLREVFELAILDELLEVNPAVFDQRMAFGPVQRQTKHMAALPWERAPEFCQWLTTHDCKEDVRQMIMAMVLTGKRTSEVRTAKWFDLCLETATWTTTSERMKMRRPHRVPICAQLAVVFDNLALLGGHPDDPASSVFPRPKNKSGVIDENRALIEIKKFDTEITGHGMRSTFRTWARKQGVFSQDVMEYALSHEKDKIVDAYLRDDLLEERRPMMQAWGDYVTGGEGPTRLADAMEIILRR